MNNQHGIVISSILPEDVIDRLKAWASEGDRSLWAIGRTARELAEELPVKRALLDATIAQACGWQACRARDVRSVATFYPDWMDEKYAVLSFSHHRVAMVAGDLSAACRWLDWCLSSADDYGGLPAPVDVLSAAMKDAGDRKGAAVWERQVQAAFRLLTRIFHSPSTPADTVDKARRLMEAFELEFEELLAKE